MDKQVKTRLRTCLKAEKFKEALTLLNKENNNNSSIRKTKILCLIFLNRFKDVLKLDVETEFLLESAYCHYRMGNLEKAKDLCHKFENGVDKANSLKTHLLSQILYKNEEYSQSLQLYNEMKNPSQEQRINMIAAIINMIQSNNRIFPFDVIGSESFIKSLMSKDQIVSSDANDGTNIELLFNRAILQSVCFEYEVSNETCIQAKSIITSKINPDNHDIKELLGLDCLMCFNYISLGNSEKARQIIEEDNSKIAIKSKILNLTLLAIEKTIKNPESKQNGSRYYQCLRKTKFNLTEFENLSQSQKFALLCNRALIHLEGKNKRNYFETKNQIKCSYPTSEIPLLLEKSKNNELTQSCLNEKTDNVNEIFAKKLSQLDFDLQQYYEQSSNEKIPKNENTKSDTELLSYFEQNWLYIPGFIKAIIEIFEKYQMSEKKPEIITNLYENSIQYFKEKIENDTIDFDSMNTLIELDRLDEISCEINTFKNEIENHLKKHARMYLITLLLDAGDFFFSKNNYPAASKYLEQSISLNRNLKMNALHVNKVVAKYVMSLSFIDPERAFREAFKLSQPKVPTVRKNTLSLESLMDGDVSDKPSIRTFSRKNKDANRNENRNTVEKDEKSESIKIGKRKNKRKPKNTQNHEEQKVDPERWLPLKQRSYYRPTKKPKNKRNTKRDK